MAIAPKSEPPTPETPEVEEMSAAQELALLLGRMPASPPPPPVRPPEGDITIGAQAPAPPPREATDWSQSLGAPNTLSYRQGRVVEVVCTKCFTQAIPKRRLYGANILTIVVAAFFPIVMGIVLTLISSPTQELDVEQQTYVDVNQVMIGWGTWIICLLLALLPAVGFHFWRIYKGRWVCLACGDTNIWEAESTVAKAALARQANRLAYPFE